MKQKIIVNMAEVFQAQIYEDNKKVVPDSAVITIYKPNGTVALISAQVMTIASDGLLSYSLTAGNNDTVDTDYRAVITYTVSAVSYETIVFYDVVRARLHIVITDEEVVTVLPQLKQAGYKVHGTASGSSGVASLEDIELVGERFPDDYFTGGKLYSIDQDATRKITDFVSVSGTVSCEAFGATLASNKYILSKSFAGEILGAFDQLKFKLRAKGIDPDKILDSGELKQVHIELSVAYICEGLTKEANDFWDSRAEKFYERGMEALNAMVFKYDENNDGYIVASEEKKQTRIVKVQF